MWKKLCGMKQQTWEDYNGGPRGSVFSFSYWMDLLNQTQDTEMM